ncbi:hypothetical protein F7725_010658 [Dissostichus mawsoni]|uniref:DH domain-containing protein n=1 Tax=Dissostichus mawsoni TaxID=36200 RepID=A0A7J5XPD1_DISMA|nr:hypothetical protein F7725_010658 [Dissostichus mawsoni]
MWSLRGRSGSQQTHRGALRASLPKSRLCFRYQCRHVLQPDGQHRGVTVPQQRRLQPIDGLARGLQDSLSVPDSDLSVSALFAHGTDSEQLTVSSPRDPRTPNTQRRMGRPAELLFPVSSHWSFIPLVKNCRPISFRLGERHFLFPPAAAVNRLIQHREKDGDETFSSEEDANVFVDETNTSTHVRLSSQDSFSDEGKKKNTEEEEEEEKMKKTLEEEAADKERAAQRQLLALEELVQSERNYLRLLQVSTVTIRSNLNKLQPPPAGLDNMFLFIEEVMDVSSRLLCLMDQKQPEDPLYLQTLCESFLSLSADIEASYKEYLSNYSNVTVLENSYKQKEMLPEVNATSLTFFLVMPVQRIARYPLLLQTIQKHTDRQHPAYALLEHTAHTSIALNCRINEYKRFREVADKYKKTETLSMKDKMNRLNTHSIAKKTARLSQQIKHETGIKPKLVDEEFDTLEGFFYVLEHGILQLLENVETYLLHLKGFLSCRTEDFDLDLDGEKALICYKEISTALRQWILPTFDLLLGPRNLIRKRLDKLLDYEMIETKTTLSYEEQGVVNTYSLALQLIWSLLGSFSCVQKDLASDMETLFLSFAQQVSVCVVGGRDLDLSLARGELVGVISWADTRGDKRRRHSYTPESQRLTVHSFQVLAAYDFTARGNHEVSMRAGEVVRVLEAKDKRGILSGAWWRREGEREATRLRWITASVLRRGDTGFCLKPFIFKKAAIKRSVSWPLCPVLCVLSSVSSSQHAGNRDVR